MGGVHVATNKEGGPWLDPNDINAFARYLRDYLLTDTRLRRR